MFRVLACTQAGTPSFLIHPKIGLNSNKPEN